MADNSGLFDDRRSRSRSRDAKTRGKKDTAETAERRIMLKPWDTVASQFLNPYGGNNFQKTTTEALWRAVAKGGFKAAFHSELATGADDKWRNGVGISRISESLEAGIKQLRSADMKALLKEGPYNKAMAEADLLMPALEKLNQGKGSENNKNAFGSIAALKRGGEDARLPATPDELDAAAKTFYDWLSRETTPLRACLSILSGDGCFE